MKKINFDNFQLLFLVINAATLFLTIIGISTYKSFNFAPSVHFSITGLESDLIQLFSISKDIYSGLSIKDFSFGAASGFFLERIFSLLFFPIIDTAEKHFFFFPIFRIVLIIFLLNYFFGKYISQNFLYSLNVLVLSFNVFNFVGFIFTTEFFFFLTRQYYISFVHGLAFCYAIIAFAIFYENKFKSNVFYVLYLFCIFLITISFIIFAIYLGSFIFIYWLFNRDISIFIRSLKIALVCIAGIVFAFLINQDNLIQFNNSSIGQASKNWFLIFKIYLFSILPSVIIYFYNCYKKNKKEIFTYLFYGNLFYVTILCLIGMLNSAYDVRYICGTFLITVMLFQLTVGNFFHNKNFFVSFSIFFFLITSILLFTNYQKNNFGLVNRYSEEVKCVKNLDKTYTIVSTYWPAKIVFELTNRKHNLFQVNAIMKYRKWLYNPSWINVHKETSGMLILINGLEMNTALKLINLKENLQGELICNNRILKTKKTSFN